MLKECSLSVDHYQSSCFNAINVLFFCILKLCFKIVLLRFHEKYEGRLMLKECSLSVDHYQSSCFNAINVLFFCILKCNKKIFGEKNQVPTVSFTYSILITIFLEELSAIPHPSALS